MKAIACNQKALDIAIKIKEEHPEVAGICDELSYAFARDENFEQALVYAESLAIELKLHGVEHQAVAQSYSSVGECYRKMGECEKAIDNFESPWRLN